MKELEIKNKIGNTIFLKAAPFKKEIRKTAPHKHDNYIEIIYLSEGTGCHTIDTVAYEIQPPVVFVVRREQVHCWEIDTLPEGFVLIIKKPFIDKSMDSELKSLFLQLSGFTCFPIQGRESSVEQLFRLLVQELKQQEYGAVVEGLLKALIGKMLHFSGTIANSVTKSETLYQKYCQLLANGPSLVNNVAYYASLLHTSPQNLNATCRKELRQSAAEVLAEFILKEAKRLLIYSDKSVSEISYVLNFKDNSHFTKYFKRLTGTTPTDFRRSV